MKAPLIGSDSFLERNPRFVELSDRKILDWVHRSGLWKQKSTGWKHSNDKPEFNFGIPALEDLSVQRVLQTVASIVPRELRSDGGETKLGGFGPQG